MRRNVVLRIVCVRLCARVCVLVCLFIVVTLSRIGWHCDAWSMTYTEQRIYGI
jgi:hypothetical protein